MLSLTLSEGGTHADIHLLPQLDRPRRLVSVYIKTGQYDGILTVDMPNGEAMIKLAVAAAAMGTVRTTTVRAFTPDEFAKLAADAPTP